MHYTTEQLTEKFSFPTKLRKLVFGSIGAGIVLLILGVFIAASGEGEDHASAEDTHASVTEQVVHTVADTDEHADEGGHGEEHHVTWVTQLGSNLLLVSLYFITIAMGAMFFLTIHRVGNAGWYTAIARVPEAITTYLPVGVVGFVAMFVLMDHVYEWMLIPAGADHLIDAKRAYLNQGFFIGRNIVFFAIWIGAALWLRRLSLQEDVQGGTSFLLKSEIISSVFIILFAISYSLFSIDWIKSLEPHWFSTIFGVYIFAGSMTSSMVVIYLIIVYLKSLGYMSYINDAHLHDIGKYAFGFSVFWGYIWVSQYLLIWYSNIPEEGIYYVKRYRVEDHAYLGYASFFYINVFLNFVIPFIALMTRNAKRIPKVFIPIGLIMLYGHWHDLFLMIMPGAVGTHWADGLIMNIGMMLIFGGAFIYVVFNALSKANLVPLKHPYLEESLHHTTGPV